MSDIGFRILPAAGAPDLDLIAQFRDIAVAHLSDSMQRMHSGQGILPLNRRARLAGAALTVRVPPGDNLMVHKALDLARPGEVIIVDAAGATTNAIIGELMSRYAIKRGVAGFVIDGAVRDSEVLSEGDFPVFARGVSHRGPFKSGPGEINVPVSIGGMVVCPGDIIVGDADGVVALGREDAPFILRAARAKAAKEQVQMEKIANGTNDRSWVDATLRSLGCAP
ncbi:RraA family protein [Bordetella petrii]|nr:RraA family protein [Bordetella petrii]